VSRYALKAVLGKPDEEINCESVWEDRGCWLSKRDGLGLTWAMSVPVRGGEKKPVAGGEKRAKGGGTSKNTC